MDFYTLVLRKSGDYWVALCLENGLAGQGLTKDDAVRSIREAADSFNEACRSEDDVYTAPVSIKELHEFLTVEERSPCPGTYELRAVYA